jgi:hypothetical protein
MWSTPPYAFMTCTGTFQLPLKPYNLVLKFAKCLLEVYKNFRTSIILEMYVLHCFMSYILAAWKIYFTCSLFANFQQFYESFWCSSSTIYLLNIMCNIFMTNRKAYNIDNGASVINLPFWKPVFLWPILILAFHILFTFLNWCSPICFR